MEIQLLLYKNIINLIFYTYLTIFRTMHSHFTKIFAFVDSIVYNILFVIKL